MHYFRCVICNVIFVPVVASLRRYTFVTSGIVRTRIATSSSSYTKEKLESRYTAKMKTENARNFFFSFSFSILCNFFCFTFWIVLNFLCLHWSFPVLLTILVNLQQNNGWRTTFIPILCFRTKSISMFHFILDRYIYIWRFYNNY